MKKFIEELKIWWASFPKDKLYHFLAGFFISALIGIPTYPAIGFACAVVAGALKEIYDRRNVGRFDWADLFATVIGGGLAAIELVIFNS